MLQLFLGRLLQFFRFREAELRDHLVQRPFQSAEIGVFHIHIRRYKAIRRILHELGDHIVHRIAHTLPVQNPAALAIDDLSLFVHDLIIF